MLTYTFVGLFCLVAEPTRCTAAVAGPELVPANMSMQMCQVVGQQIASVMLNEFDTMIDGEGPFVFRSWKCVAGREA